MKVEILFFSAYLYGDEANAKYLEKCLPAAEFVYTKWGHEPLFMTEAPDLIYMGAMSEKNQEKAIAALLPCTDRLRELKDGGTVMLFTSNAMEDLGEYILDEDKKIPALGLYGMYTKREMMNRYNGLVLGRFEDIDIVGFKSQFGHMYGSDDHPFMSVLRGRGMNKDCASEGFHDHNLFATYLIGPLLILNPYFTKYLLRLLGAPDTIPFEELTIKTYNDRLAEFRDEKRKVE